MDKTKFSVVFMDWVMTFVVVGIIAAICNVVGYDGQFLESIPGLLIFACISLAGLTVKHFVPGNLPAVAYISIIGILVAMPLSPISEFVVYWAGKVALMATVTPILAYAGVIVGRDWKDFAKIGWKGIFVSVLVIFGTFLISGGIAQILGMIL